MKIQIAIALLSLAFIQLSFAQIGLATKGLEVTLITDKAIYGPGESIYISSSWTQVEGTNYYELRYEIKRVSDGVVVKEYKPYPIVSPPNNIHSFTWTAPDTIGEYYVELGVKAYGPEINGKGQKFFNVGSNTLPITTVPEFPTIALPVAIILGIAFIIYSRNNKI